MSEDVVISQSEKRRLQKEIEKSAQVANNEFKAISEGLVISQSAKRRLEKET